MGFSELELLGVKSLRSSAVFGGRLKRPSTLPYPFRTWPGSGTWAERDKRKVRIFFVFWVVYARAIIESWHMQSLNDKNIYHRKTLISKLAYYFVPTTLFSWSHLEAFGLLSYDCCVLAFRNRISRLNTFVRAFVVFEGGRSLPNIITPSVRADCSSQRDTTYYVVTDGQTVV